MRDLIDRSAIKLPPHFFENVDNVPKFYEWLNSLPTASPWHKVEEPPKDSKPVICWEKQGFPYVDRYFPKYGWEFASNALAEPIYWMPIEPPKEDA